MRRNSRGTGAVIWLSCLRLGHVASLWHFSFLSPPFVGAGIETLQWHSHQSLCLPIPPALMKL